MSTGTLLRAGLGGAIAGALLWVVAASSAAAQAAPNIEGVWKIASPTQTLKPVSGDVPFTETGLAAFNANKKFKASKAFDEYDITASRCSNPGVPRLMLTNKRFKIWNRQNVLTFDFEWNRALRQIDVRGVEVETPFVPNRTGVSLGKWEGDTLVVTTTNLSERTLIDELVPHGYDLKVTERYRLVDPNTLENRITIEDPEYFIRPWDAVVTYTRQPQDLFREDICLDRLQAKGSTPAWP